ncbi:MAG: lysophospholipid acyltransferase family protein [Pseudomonadota bacterium]
MLSRLFGIYWLACFGVFALLGVALVAVTPGQPNRRRIARACARTVFWLTGMPPRFENADALPTSSCVVVANHASYLDGIIMMATLPARFAFVIKKEITAIPLVHFLLRRIGSHFVTRTNPHAGAADALQILRSTAGSDSLGFFPEGTFKRQPGLNPFKPGAFRIAARAGWPVVPVVIHGSRQILPDGRVLPAPGQITVTLTDPVTAAEPEALMRLARRQILDILPEPDLQAAAD